MNKKNDYNEIKLMLCASKTNLSCPDVEKIATYINKAMDWQFMLSNLNKHGVSNLVYRNLNKMNFDEKIPSFICSKFRKNYSLTVNENLRLWSKFIYLQRILEKEKIKIIPFKGILLFDSLYHDPGLRPMVDIDILVQEKDLFNAKNIILNLGYKATSENLSYEYRRKFHCHFTFQNPERNILLELHWAFAPPRPNRIDLTEVWQRAELRKIDNQEVLTLTLEDTLLSLCINFCKNIPNLQSIPLKNLVDIHEIIYQHNDKLDWNYIINKLTQWRIKGCFYYLYSLTKNLLETPWPEEIIKQIYPPILQRKVLNFYDSKLEHRSQIQVILLMMLMLDSSIDTIKLTFKLIAQAFSIFIQSERTFSAYLKR